jgi:hypothetical protein
MGPIVMVVEHCKIVDQSPKIGPMLKVENVSIVVPLQPLCGEEMEMDIIFVMPVDCITK